MSQTKLEVEQALAPGLDTEVAEKLAKLRSILRGFESVLMSAALHHPGPEVILAFDADDAGRALVAEVSALLADCGKTITAEYPSQGKDWNEQLQSVNARIRELAHSRIQECSTEDHASRARRSRTQNEERER